jgi:hypothetical protein
MSNTINLSKYEAPFYEAALYQDIPIGLYSLLREQLIGKGVRYRFRGARRYDSRPLTRPYWVYRRQRQSDCLLETAEFVSVYSK